LVQVILEALDDSTIERAGALIAREQTAARQRLPLLSASFGDARFCTEALRQLLDAGSRGVVVIYQGRLLAVMTAGVRDIRTIGRYARLPAEGLAVDPARPSPRGIFSENAASQRLEAALSGKMLDQMIIGASLGAEQGAGQNDHQAWEVANFCGDNSGHLDRGVKSFLRRETGPPPARPL